MGPRRRAGWTERAEYSMSSNESMQRLSLRRTPGGGPRAVRYEYSLMHGGRRQPAEITRLERVVTQQALFDSQASLAALAHAGAWRRPPKSVFVGIGLSAPRELSRALPFDALGMLLAAEQARRAVGAETMTVLIADAHALTNGHSPDVVAQCASAHQRILGRVIERLAWSHVQLVRARELHALELHARVHAEIRRAAPSDEHPYVTRELADIEYFARTGGGILKVGWALSARSLSVRDERAFDERFRRCVGAHVPFVYCKAGRTLDDRRRKAPPYLLRDPSRRVCLASGERVHDKLARASAHVSSSTLRGVRRHLKAITRCYKQLVRPLEGEVEDQVQMLLEQVLGPEGVDDAT